MPNIRAVCFDLDGLMFNTEVIFNEVGHELLRRRDRDGEETLRELAGESSTLAAAQAALAGDGWSHAADAIRTTDRTPSERDFAPSWVQSASKA